ILIFFISPLASISKEPGEDDANVEEEEDGNAAAATDVRSVENNMKWRQRATALRLPPAQLHHPQLPPGLTPMRMPAVSRTCSR
uniref:Uncharacterized protein n=1 Tax=Seriola dumerili TaxID=41447 RepID=A0A3B4V4E9_SERDU